MTIGKRFLTFAICGLLIFSMALTLTSCKGKIDEENDSDDALSMLLEIVDSVSETTAAESDYCVVIIPSGATSSLVRKADQLVREIEKFIGIDSVLEYDNGDNPKRENALEIILGNTDRNESRIALAELRAGDYVCKRINQSIVIGGVSDDDTIIAVDKFINEILPYLSAELLMDLETGFEHFEERESEAYILLCGFPIRDFGIVCAPESKANESALKIREGVLERSGYALAMSESQRKGSKDIILEIAHSDSYVGEGYISYNGEDVTLLAYDLYGMQAVVDHFCAAVLADEQTDDICLNEDWRRLTVKCPNFPVNVKVFAFDEQSPSFARTDCVSAIYKDIAENVPSLAVINEVSESTWNFMRAAMPDGYAYKTFGEESIFAILYDPDRVELSANITESDGFSLADVSILRSGGEPSYKITYLYSDSLNAASSVEEKIETLISSENSDMVLVSLRLSEENADFTFGRSVLKDKSTVHEATDGYIYVDALKTERQLSFSDILCEDLKCEGKSFGFLCRKVEMSFCLAGFSSHN